ncbi:MAG: hypothetical protein IMZ63_03800 [Actinobacteria bacterium]|nr:hypothetical protein [Actinomycetota bacterium]
MEEILFYAKQIEFSKNASKKLDETDIYKRREENIDKLIKERFPEPKWIIEDNT